MIHDVRHLSLGILRAKQRPETTHIVLHRIGVVDKKDRNVVSADPHEVINFFLNDPEGVATSTMAWQEAQLMADVWRKKGIPEIARRRAMVPYHFLVDRDGDVWICLPEDVIGAHAYGANSKSIGIGICGDFRRYAPGAEQRQAVVDLCVDLILPSRDLKIVGHDDVRAWIGHAKKDCPGKFVDVNSIRDDVNAEIKKRDRLPAITVA